MQRLTDGFLAVRRPASLVGFHLLTVLVWTVDTLALVAAARAFDLVLAPLDAALVLAALGLSMAAPSGPGYVGIYHLVGVTVMVPMGFAKAEALASGQVSELTTIHRNTDAAGQLSRFPGVFRVGAGLSPRRSRRRASAGLSHATW